MKNMNNNTLVFTATFNEIDNIKDFIDEINKLDCKLDVLIIDDNSPDGTGNFIEKKAKSSDNLTLIRREKKLGLDTAHKFAYNYAIKNNFVFLLLEEVLPTFLAFVNPWQKLYYQAHPPKFLPHHLENKKAPNFG